MSASPSSATLSSPSALVEFYFLIVVVIIFVVQCLRCRSLPFINYVSARRRFIHVLLDTDTRTRIRFNICIRIRIRSAIYFKAKRLL